MSGLMKISQRTHKKKEKPQLIEARSTGYTAYIKYSKLRINIEPLKIKETNGQKRIVGERSSY